MLPESPKYPDQSVFPPEDFILPGAHSRRHVIKALLGAALVGINGLSAANEVVTNMEWPANEPALRLLPYARHLVADSAELEGWLTADGLGHQSGHDEAAQFAGAAFNNRKPMAYFDYANNDISTDSLAPLVAEYAERVDLFSVYGDSLGGPVALEAARLAGKPLHRIVLNCAPFDLSDAWQADEARLVSRLDPHGGFLGEFLYNLAGSSSYNPKKDIRDALKATTHGIPPALWTAQLSLLTRIDLAAKRDDYQSQGIITADTKVLYCAPKNLRSDGLVNDAQAAKKYAAFFGSFGASFDYAALSEPGHANTLAAAQYAKHWLIATS